MAIQFSAACRNAMMDAITTIAGASCLLRIYDDTGTTPAAVSNDNNTNVLLAELACNATFAPGASGGVLTLNAITSDASANASGNLDYFRIYKSDGTTCVLQGTARTSGGDMNFGVTAFVAGGTVNATSFVLTAPGA
jgi:hypothetical protein